MTEHKRTIIEISPKTIFWALGVGLVLTALYFVIDIIAILIFAIIIASAIEPILRFAEGKRVPRIISLIVIYLVFLVFFAAFLYIIFPLLLDQFRDFTENYPTYFGKLEEAAGTVTFLPGFSANIHNLLVQLTEQIPNFTSLIQYASQIFGGILSLLVVVVVSFYLALFPRALDDFLKSIMPVQFESYALDLWTRAQRKMGLWLQAQIVLSLIMGIVVFIGLWALGVKYAFLVAIVATIFEIVPFVGPIVTGAVATLFAVSQSPTLGLWTLIFFVVAQQLENHILVPIFSKRLIGLNPVAVIIALLIGAKLGGILGVLLAVPLLAVADEFFEDISKRKVAHIDIL